MKITWRDGVTTVTTAAAVVAERAYYRDWNWPLMSSTRWTIGILAVLMAVGFIYSYTLDGIRSTSWTVVASVLGLAALVMTGLGLIYAVSGYVVVMMTTVVVFWAAAILRHLTVDSQMARTHSHA